MQRLRDELARFTRFAAGLREAFPWPAQFAAALPDETIVCRCEAITAGELRRVVRETGAQEANRAKAFSRVGMGRCQGRYLRTCRRAKSLRAAACVPLGIGGTPARPGARSSRCQWRSPKNRRSRNERDSQRSGCHRDRRRHHGDDDRRSFCAGATRSVILLERGLTGQQASGINFGGMRRQGRALPQLAMANRALRTWQPFGGTARRGRRIPAGRATRACCYHQKRRREFRSVCSRRPRLRAGARSAAWRRVVRALPVPAAAKCWPPRVSPLDGHANPRLAAPAFGRAAGAARRAGSSRTREIVRVEKDVDRLSRRERARRRVSRGAAR